jgi:ABC-type polysaccharide/polyol phosphate transport system ATPase subunit
MIILSEVSKEFAVPDKLRGSLFQTLVSRLNGDNRNKSIWALDKISLRVDRGEIIGIIGSNGCGKSTLLRVIAGIYKATSGRVEAKGGITSVLQLGIGFLPDLSLRENVFLFGAFLGLDRGYINKNISEIIDFSGLEEFTNAEVRTLSLGMRERLAFSIIVHACKDILLMDETFAAGDQKFKEKCFEVMKSFRKEKKTVIFSSHELDMVMELCDKVLLLDKGRKVAFDRPEYVIAEYKRMQGRF